MAITRTDPTRRPLGASATITTRALSDNLTQVSAGRDVIGFVRTQWNGYAALRGGHLAVAREIGCYPRHGLALEALRQRPRTI